MQTLEQRLGIQVPTLEQRVVPAWLKDTSTEIFIKRDDLMHQAVSGNKWRKLKYQLASALESNVTHIVSFGGGFSNHLHALGYCCSTLNIKFTAIVRGDYSKTPSPMLQDLKTWGCDIQYVNKLDYKQRNQPEYLEKIKQHYPNVLIIPEGGSSKYALRGVTDIVHELKHSYDYIISPVASGGTLAGLINGLATSHPQTKVIGVGVLKGKGYLEELVQGLLPKSHTYKNWHIKHDYHMGGYAKKTLELVNFCDEFFRQTKIEIEPVYSGKLLFGIKDLLEQDYFPAKSRVLALHTGGLQSTR